MQTVLSLILLISTTPLSIFTQETNIKTVYDKEKNRTKVSTPLLRISDDKDPYHSLDFSVCYEYPGQISRLPEQVSVELVSVVKARKLNTDLYVLFLVDGLEKHFGSSRSAIPNPVPGRLWIGERMIFSLSYNEFRQLATAEKIAVKLGGVSFEFSDEAREVMRQIARLMPQYTNYYCNLI